MDGCQMNEDLAIFLEDLLIYLDNQIVALTQLKVQIRKLVGLENSKSDIDKAWSWIPQKIKWTKTKGARGEYERYPLENCRIEITADYKNLLQDLKEHNCFLFREGYNYWLFPDLVTIGRKRKEVGT